MGTPRKKHERRSKLEPIAEGFRSGHLVVIDGEPKLIDGRNHVLCVCEQCGKATIIGWSFLLRSKRKSCGCEKPNNLNSCYEFVANLGLRPIPGQSYQATYWRVRCKLCGQIYERPTGKLKGGAPCVCLRSRRLVNGVPVTAKDLAAELNQSVRAIQRKLKAGKVLTRQKEVAWKVGDTVGLLSILAAVTTQGGSRSWEVECKGCERHIVLRAGQIKAGACMRCTARMRIDTSTRISRLSQRSLKGHETRRSNKNTTAPAS